VSVFTPPPRPEDPAAVYLRSLSFIFHGHDVLLIHSPRDAAYWNVIGGRINRGEEPLEAAQREVWEEAGIRPALEFRGVATAIVRSTGEHWAMFLFSGRVAERTVVESPEGPLRWAAPREIATLPVFPDLPYLLPYMAGSGTLLAKFTYATPDARALEVPSIQVAVY
jgi:8-oxo-dGTP pyrophosphatase MutT (NUDIX family)